MPIKYILKFKKNQTSKPGKMDEQKGQVQGSGVRVGGCENFNPTPNVVGLTIPAPWVLTKIFVRAAIHYGWSHYSYWQFIL